MACFRHRNTPANSAETVNLPENKAPSGTDLACTSSVNRRFQISKPGKYFGQILEATDDRFLPVTAFECHSAPLERGASKPIRR